MLTFTLQDEDCSNLVFLAKLAKDLRNEYDAALNLVIQKAKKVEELNFDMKEEKLKNSQHLKALIWDLHPKMMNQISNNPVLIELEETLDMVREYFTDEPRKAFKDEVDEIDILNKNGHFAFVCSKMDYYNDLDKRMSDDTTKLTKATARAKMLVSKLTNFKLNKEMLRKMLREEFSKRKLLNKDTIHKHQQASNNVT